jgi:hypothetical protein
MALICAGRPHSRSCADRRHLRAEDARRAAAGVATGGDEHVGIADAPFDTAPLPVLYSSQDHYHKGEYDLGWIGLILCLAYRLRRHLLLGWSVARWVGFLMILVGIWALFYWWPSPWPAVAVAALLLAYLLVLAWATRSGFLRFRPLPEEETRIRALPAPPVLRPEEMVPARASGHFVVEGLAQYLIGLEADFETVETREHIVLARKQATRFLWLARWPGYEVGWWYIFFQPHMIREMAVGHLYVGRHPDLALRVVYALQEEAEHVVYLAFDNGPALRRVWDDLLLDATPGAAA